MFETSLPIPFICANATGIEQGTLLTLTDPFTASANSAIVIGATVAGIAAAEKIASDGVLTVPVYRSTGNLVEKAATNEEDILGTALETSTDTQTLLIELKPFGISLA